MSLIPGSFIFEDIVEAQRFEEYIVKSSIHTHDRRRPTPKGPDLWLLIIIIQWVNSIIASQSK